MAGKIMVGQVIRRQSDRSLSHFSFFQSSRERSFPLDQKYISYYAYARAALLDGIFALGLKSGDEVLIPEYICNAAVAPFHRAGIKIIFYEVKSNLAPDWEDVSRRLTDRTRALLIVNYFGFPNDLDGARYFCDQNHLFLIEDNAHGFLSAQGERPLGSWGDISVFAFHKMIHIPGGAALLMNIDAPLNQKASLKKEPLSVIRFFLKNILQRLPGTRDRELDAEGIIQKIRPSAVDVAEEDHLEKYLLAISSWSRYVLDHLCAEKVKAARRKNYQEWMNYFKRESRPGIRVLFNFLPEGICPYVFAVYANDREAFMREMASKGVETFAWPYLPRNSKEQDLSRHVVCLPVHQGAVINEQRLA